MNNKKQKVFAIWHYQTPNKYKFVILKSNQYRKEYNRE
jgi:hypothetical protein